MNQLALNSVAFPAGWPGLEWVGTLRETPEVHAAIAMKADQPGITIGPAWSSPGHPSAWE